MERTFAGFWRDGAVVKPEFRHLDSHHKMTFKRKSNGENITLFANIDDLAEIYKFYWLDTTTPTELTPQQAFELLKVVFPKAKRIVRDSAFAITFDCDGETSINWGETTEYPPREHWRVPTDADKGKRCRAYHSNGDIFFATFAGVWGGKFLIETEIEGDIKVWGHCEVICNEQ
jgi:hypothetical protein